MCPKIDNTILHYFERSFKVSKIILFLLHSKLPFMNTVHSALILIVIHFNVQFMKLKYNNNQLVFNLNISFPSKKQNFIIQNLINVIIKSS